MRTLYLIERRTPIEGDVILSAWTRDGVETFYGSHWDEQSEPDVAFVVVEKREVYE